MDRTQYYEWFNRYEHVRISLDTDLKPGQTSTSTDDNHVEIVRAVIPVNRPFTEKFETLLKGTVTVVLVLPS